MNNLDKPPRSSRAVVKALEELGFNGVQLWKDPATKHYVFSVYHELPILHRRGGKVTVCFSGETIECYDLRIKDWTLKQWLQEFFYKAEETGWHEDFHPYAEILNPLVENLRKQIL